MKDFETKSTRKAHASAKAGPVVEKYHTLVYLLLTILDRGRRGGGTGVVVNSKPCGRAIVLLKFFSFQLRPHDCDVGDFKNSMVSSTSRVASLVKFSQRSDQYCSSYVMF